MQVDSFPHQELRHPTLAVPATLRVYLQVGASDPCDGADIHADLCFFFRQVWVPALTQGKGPSKQKHPRVCVHIMMVSPLVYCAPAAKKPRETPKFWGAKGDTEKFGPLKVALGNIPALSAIHTVCLQSPAHNHHFTQFSGNYRSGEQGLKPPLRYSRIGGLFRFASEQRAGA